MSVINQVLKDLDKRGVAPNTVDPAIRVVPGYTHRDVLLWVTAGAIGMLAIGGAVVLYLQYSATTGQTKAAAITQQVAPVPAPQVNTAPPAADNVQAKVVPSIQSVSPELILASGVPQLISLHGRNLGRIKSVTLTDDKGKIYPDRPILTRTEELIVLKLNLGRSAATWHVTLSDDTGANSGQFAFSVQLPRGTRQMILPIQDKPVSTSSTQEPLPEPSAAGGVDKRATQISLQQQAENEYRRSYQLLRQGQANEALNGFENTIKLDPYHEQARQVMAGMLIDRHRNDEAEQVLRAGLQLNQQQTRFAMLLARLQVERNALQDGLETLQKSLPYAERQAEYHSFMAAVLQRLNRHGEAIQYFSNALQLKPGNAVWLMGLGISLRAEQRNEEARAAFRQALEQNTLNSELKAFVQQQLKELS